MISLDKAMRKMASRFPEYEIAACREYENNFYFDLTTHDYQLLFDSGYVLDRKTGKISKYNIGIIGYENIGEFLDSPLVFVNPKVRHLL